MAGIFHGSLVPKKKETVYRVRQNFMAMYNLTEDTAPPLLELSFHGDQDMKGHGNLFIDGESPFLLVKQGLQQRGKEKGSRDYA